MTCVEVRERLGAFLDGEDPAPGEVDAHLRGCPSCAAALAELRAELAELDAALAPVAARAEAGAARALAGLPPDHRSGGVPWWGLPLAAAAGFLLAMVFVPGGDRSSMRPPPDTAALEKAQREREAVAAEVEKVLRTPEVGCDVEGPDRKLRKLGAACVEPAAAWVAAADPEKDVFGRHVAAKVVAELATREQAGLLLRMMGDTDVQVRLYANRGLARLSGLVECPEEMVRKEGTRAEEAWRKVFGAR